jgi:hypothetical protein
LLFSSVNNSDREKLEKRTDRFREVAEGELRKLDFQLFEIENQLTGTIARQLGILEKSLRGTLSLGRILYYLCGTGSKILFLPLKLTRR